MFHVHIGYRSRDGGTSCEAARQYIVREGKYRKRGDVVRMVASIHMPDWAGDRSANAYWAAAEGNHSRANGRTALLLEFALPRDLPKFAQNALALEMAEAVSAMGLESGPEAHRLPVTFAIHEGYGRNPHVHMLISTSINDNIVRPKERWFKRFQRSAPERGGAQRLRFLTKIQWVHMVRELWARLANKALVSFGLPGDLDHRSNVSRGLLAAPTVHLGPRLAGLASRGVMTPRLARSRKVTKDNEAIAELEAAIVKRRREVVQLEEEARDLRRRQQAWSAEHDSMLHELLSHHPLGGGADELRSEASAMVLEADQANRKAVRAAFDKAVGASVLEVAGKTWDVVRPGDKVWLIHPDKDAVVVLGPGYLATDAMDDEGMSTMLTLAKALPFERPLVVAQESLLEKVESLLRHLGSQWKPRALRARRVQKPRL
jgi:hypothetical protein